MVKFLFIVLLFPLSLIACATPSTLLVTQDGQVHRCSAYGTGLAGVSMAAEIHGSCVKDFKMMGAVEYPKVSWGIDTNWEDTKAIKIHPGTPAEKDGVLVGDIVLEVDNIPVEKSFDMVKIFSNKLPGDKILVKLNRSGQEIELQSSLTVKSAVQ